MTQLKKAPRTGRPEDPQLRRMLSTHIHCGEKMQPANQEHRVAPRPATGKDTPGILTYRCACGFCFDEEAG